MYFVNVINKKTGDFEILDGELLHLYPRVSQEGLIPITEKQYQYFSENDNGETRFLNGEFVFKTTSIDVNTQLNSYKLALLRKISIKTDHLKGEILADYPQAEIESFYRQEREARAWQADNNTVTPMLSAIADSRGVPLAVLAGKVIEKADKIAVVVGQIIGTKQAFEDRIHLAKTEAELTAYEQEIEEWTLSI